MRLFILFKSILFATLIHGQNISTFENFDLSEGEYLHNAGETGGFESGLLYFPNDYNAAWDSWTGWAISATTDTITPGFLNQFSAISGSGADNSITYGVSYVLGESILKFSEGISGQRIEGLQVTNSTFAYRSMLEGDTYAKRFGGETGNDPDFFLLTVKKFNNGELSTDSVDFYLADYRFEDNSLDYIMKEWTYLDLSSLGELDSLSFTLSSSDVGSLGMNTPAYFCVDNIIVYDLSGLSEEQYSQFTFDLFPNPASDHLTVDWKESEEADLIILDLNGKPILQKNLAFGKNQINTHSFSSGIYFLKIENENGWHSSRFIKQ